MTTPAAPTSSACATSLPPIPPTRTRHGTSQASAARTICWTVSDGFGACPPPPKTTSKPAQATSSTDDGCRIPANAPTTARSRSVAESRARAPPASGDIEDLARVEDPVRIEVGLDRAHQRNEVAVLV